MADRAPTHHPRSALVTGGMGFIGSNLVRHLLASDAALRVVNLDALTYAGNPGNLAGLPDAQASRHHFIKGDICDAAGVERLLREHAIDTVIHLAAESHVDRSQDGPMEYVRTNVVGTATLLHAARGAWQGRTDVRPSIPVWRRRWFGILQTKSGSSASAAAAIRESGWDSFQ